MKNPQTVSDWTNSVASVVNPDHNSADRLAAELTIANARITALESKLSSKQAALGRLLADDLRTCEELAELKKTIWGYHRLLPGGCDCTLCLEVAPGQRPGLRQR